MPKSYIPLVLISFLVIGIIFSVYHFTFVVNELQNIFSYQDKSFSVQNPTTHPTTTVFPTQMVTLMPSSIRRPAPSKDTTEWGKAQKIDDVTYTIKVGYDGQMATPQEITDALNSYRSVQNRGSLTQDDRLSQYAQSRADYFKSNNDTDKHAGFNSFLENENGFQTLGFRRMGENSYFGGKLNGVHLIEWVFAQSPGHNANQLDEGWSHIGIGVTETSVNIIFGGDKI